VRPKDEPVRFFRKRNIKAVKNRVRSRKAGLLSIPRPKSCGFAERNLDAEYLKPFKDFLEKYLVS